MRLGRETAAQLAARPGLQAKGQRKSALHPGSVACVGVAGAALAVGVRKLYTYTFGSIKVKSVSDVLNLAHLQHEHDVGSHLPAATALHAMPMAHVAHD